MLLAEKKTSWHTRAQGTNNHCFCKLAFLLASTFVWLIKLIENLNATFRRFYMSDISIRHHVKAHMYSSKKLAKYHYMNII